MFVLSDPVRVSSIIDLVETRFLTTTRASHHPCDNGLDSCTTLRGLRLDRRFPPRSSPVTVGPQQVRLILTAPIIGQRAVRSFVLSFDGDGPAHNTLMPENSGEHLLPYCKPQRNVAPISLPTPSSRPV